jgi:CheY-like chemotaxis protein
VPAAAAPALAAAAAAAAAGRAHRAGPAQFGDPHALAGIRVLVVEDSLDARELIRDLIAAHGAEVLEADSGRAALAVVAAFAPSVIVSDIGMPEMDGYDLLRELRQRGVAAPAIALTAFTALEDRQRALAAGFAAHLPKPLKVEQLIGQIVELGGGGDPAPRA